MRSALLATALTASLVAPAAAGAANQPLVDTAWLTAHRDDGDVVIIDIRDNVENTDLGDKPYIAEAVVAPYEKAGWRTTVDGVPGQVPPAEEISATIGKLGISATDHVVIVPWGTDSSDFGTATRVYWTFKYLGDNNVSILDGGWRQYDAAGGPRAAAPASRPAVTFIANVQPRLRATTADVEAALRDGSSLIDGRPTAQFEGKAKSPAVRVAGTLPGAVSLPNSDFYSADHARFAKPEAVAALADKVGLKADGKTIAFCNTGHLASVVWFGFSEILGDKNASLYDGSMSEWTRDPNRPVVQ